MSFRIPFLGRLKIKPKYAIRPEEYVLFRTKRMAITFRRRRAVRRGRH